MAKVIPSAQLRFVANSLIWLVMVLLLIPIAVGCGRKGPPIPPRATPPPQVIGLTGYIENGVAELTWRLEARSIAREDIDSFYLYQSTAPLGQPGCDDCAKRFARIAEIPLLPYTEQPDGGAQWHHRLSLHAESRYLFKVNVRLSNGVLGPDPEILELEN